MKGPAPRSLEERLLDKFTVGDDCWNWTAAQNGNGYGVIGRTDGSRLAHRTVYEWLVGPIPVDLTIDHLCRNRLCVRPDHLEPVTQRVNNLRSDGLAAQEVLRTECPRGHAYTEANTYVQHKRNTRMRICRECRRMWDRIRRPKRGVYQS